MIKKIKDLFDENTVDVVKKSGLSLFIKVLGVGVLFANSAFLGRVLGPKGIGIINISLKFTAVLLMLSLLGVPNLLVKKISIAQLNKKWDTINSVVYSSFKINTIASLIIVLITMILAPYFLDTIFKEEGLNEPFKIILIGMIPQSFIRLISSIILGFQKVWQSNLLNETLSAILVSILLLVCYVFKISITLNIVACIYAISYFFVSIIALIYWKSIFNYKSSIIKKSNGLILAALPFLLVNGAGIIASNTDILMIGWLNSAYNAGLYSVAVQVSLVTSFFLLVSNSAISPKLAVMYSQGDVFGINKMVQKITIGLLIIGLLFLLFFLFLGKKILLFWGVAFVDAYPLLIILSVGQFFNIGTGCAGFVLIMCGYEKIHAILSISFVVFNIILNFVLIHQFGVLGAAIATATAIGLENIIKVVLAYRTTGILTINIFKRISER